MVPRFESYLIGSLQLIARRPSHTGSIKFAHGMRPGVVGLWDMGYNASNSDLSS